ncbi:hypothetical protein PMAYCL1PPCAC_07024 [Pristionchus mayeri]|uniref:alpha,alpha-trehalose-phosphate synthase (UDP-forming) n=1 Tax=Pristionchus mayeri TaxID=1317129 RepID=A0AAN5CC38_9BILA|nr:hypothetical protein PMAYCL1PPCAC_07024 [Pristionchus mayeri]
MEDDTIQKYLHDQPFQRRLGTQVTEGLFTADLLHILHNLEVEADGRKTFPELMNDHFEMIGSEWKKKANKSEMALQGMLLILEYCMWTPATSSELFERLVNFLGFHSIQFWKIAVPVLFESDFTASTKYRDALLFSLALYDVNTGKSRLKEVYAAVPGSREALLGENAKAFGEKFHHLKKRISRHNSRASLLDEVATPGKDRSPSAGAENGYDSDTDHSIPSGLASAHFHQRVINVSNAPPVSLKKEKTGEWEIKQGSGGLVSCVDPVMSKHEDNVWLANLGMNVGGKGGKRPSNSDQSHSLAPATNTLGLPLIKQTIAEVLFHVLAEEDEVANVKDKNKEREDLSLLGVLNHYNRGRYKLNPVVVQEEDYNVYYGGISNGLLWPALHNLPEYISDEYKDPKIIRDHWCSYVRVNYQFAIDAVRNSRPQDFIWIHDYHLVLVGLIMQSLDPNLEVGFFLHIPFQPPDSFFDQFALCAIPLLRGLLRFTKVGFQTHRDRDRFVAEVEKYFKSAKICFDKQLDIYTITLEGVTCSLGVFPVSIKNEDFLQFVSRPETQKLSADIRKKMLGPHPTPDTRLFFSVERFDYTKGIREKLHGWRKYLEIHPERRGKDVLYQIAVTNRRSVDMYRVYQDECMAIVEEINREFATKEWTPIVFECDGLPRDQLVAAYCAMDIGVVTPRKDGMNLVAKEMIVVNPRAGLILSTGAGSEIQFYNAGLYGAEGERNYTRIEDLYDPLEYAACFYDAATLNEEERAKRSKKIHEFLLAHDIERWSTAFLDPRWTHHVIKKIQIETIDDFFSLMIRTRHIRRQIVERVLEGVPIRQHFCISLTNARDSLLASTASPNTLRVRAPKSSDIATFDIQNEISELERDLSFIEYVESDDPDNIEQFVESLSKGMEYFHEQVDEATALLTKADHFFYFFTDRDGTLKSYSCAYPASIQPAYSGVIQAQFARRCAQTCAILTTAPMMNTGILDVGTIPEGYYYYGASGGREWYVSPSIKFRDGFIQNTEQKLLDELFNRLSLLVEEEEFHVFSWIGSGLQKHYGHVTIAHQDVHGSISTEKGTKLKKKVEEITKEIDESGELMAVVHSDRETKVLLKTEAGQLFDKGNGLRMLCTNLNIDLKEGNILVCGDSSTDLPMLEECLQRNSSGVFTIWVTQDRKLQEKVRALCGDFSNSNFVFVNSPEVLLGAMAQATIRETCRPRQYI